MKKIGVGLIAFLLLHVAAGTIRAQGTYTSHVDVPYVNDGNVRHRLDLHIPDGATSPTPVIVWIHGGGWQGGNKTLGPNSLQLRYARSGYALVSINYRLSSEAIFPAQINDCKAAIRWLRANAATYNLDPTRIGVWGSSAGGHLAALLGTSNDVVDLEGNVGTELSQPSRVQAVGDWYGPTDFLQMDAQLQAQGCGPGSHNSASSPESLLVGCQIQTCPAAVARANPMTYFSVDDPPFFIQHGTADCTVPTGQSQILSTLMLGAAHDSQFLPLVGAGHGGPQFSAESNLLLLDQFWASRLRDMVNPLVTRVRIFRKRVERQSFAAGSLGSLYRIAIEGINLDSTRVLINGIERAGVSSGTNGMNVYGIPGRITAAGEMTLQLRAGNGRHSNIVRVPIE